MSEVGIRALKQNASAVVAEAASGELVTITDRGRPVAMMGPVGSDVLADMLRVGRARPARTRLIDLPRPARRRRGAPPLSDVLEEMRDRERY